MCVYVLHVSINEHEFKEMMALASVGSIFRVCFNFFHFEETFSFLLIQFNGISHCLTS